MPDLALTPALSRARERGRTLLTYYLTDVLEIHKSFRSHEGDISKVLGEGKTVPSQPWVLDRAARRWRGSLSRRVDQVFLARGPLAVLGNLLRLQRPCE